MFSHSLLRADFIAVLGAPYLHVNPTTGLIIRTTPLFRRPATLLGRTPVLLQDFLSKYRVSLISDFSLSGRSLLMDPPCALGTLRLAAYLSGVLASTNNINLLVAENTKFHRRSIANSSNSRAIWDFSR
jgi:hypothetical protein